MLQYKVNDKKIIVLFVISLKLDGQISQAMYPFETSRFCHRNPYFSFKCDA